MSITSNSSDSLTRSSSQVSHHLKVSILEPNNVEKFYIKFYHGKYESSSFEGFKSIVIKRNPIVGQANVRFYWIDSENDKILICCEEDFRLFLENKESGLKIYIKIAEAKAAHDKDKKVLKRSKRSEKSVKRCEKIRKLFASIDPASLCESSKCQSCKETKSVINGCSLSDYHVNPETIRILSATIKDCMKPCHYINSILNDIHTMFSNIDGSAIQPSQSFGSSTNLNVTVEAQTSPQDEPDRATAAATKPAANWNPFEQEIAAEPAHNDEPEPSKIEDQFSLDNEPKMPSFEPEVQMSSVNLSHTVPLKDDDPILTASVFSDEAQAKIAEITATTLATASAVMESLSSMHKADSIESLSSVEVCSHVDEDSREWTILDAVNDEQSDGKSTTSDEDEKFVEVYAEQDENEENEEKETNEQKEVLPEQDLNITDEHFEDKSASVETVKSLDPSIDNKITENIEALSSGSGQKCDESSANLNLVPEVIITSTSTPLMSIATVSDVNQSIYSDAEYHVEEPSSETQENLNNGMIENSRNDQSVNRPSAVDVSDLEEEHFDHEPMQFDDVNNNINDDNNNDPQMAAPQPSHDPSYLYHTNERINAAIHSMVQMGFDNEGEWLTQLMVNLNGDVAEAINFLAPRNQ